LVRTDRDGKLMVRRCNKNLSRRQIETILIERGELACFDAAMLKVEFRASNRGLCPAML